MKDFGSMMFTWAATQMIEIAQKKGTAITWRAIYEELNIPTAHWYNRGDLDEAIPYLAPKDIVSLVEARFRPDEVN
jgi:hypothetical protein